MELTAQELSMAGGGECRFNQRHSGGVQGVVSGNCAIIPDSGTRPVQREVAADKKGRGCLEITFNLIGRLLVTLWNTKAAINAISCVRMTFATAWSLSPLKKFIKRKLK